MGGSVSVFADVDVNAFTLEWIELRSLGSQFYLNVTFKHVAMETSTQYVLRGHYAWVKDGIYVGPDHKEVKGDVRHHCVNTNELTMDAERAASIGGGSNSSGSRSASEDDDKEDDRDETEEKPRPKTDFKSFNDVCRPYDLQYTVSLTSLFLSYPFGFICLSTYTDISISIFYFSFRLPRKVARIQRVTRLVDHLQMNCTCTAQGSMYLVNRIPGIQLKINQLYCRIKTRVLVMIQVVQFI